MHHDYRLIFASEQRINSFLIFDAALAIINHHLRFHARWFDALAVVLHDIFTYLLDALLAGEECFHIGTAHQLLALCLVDLIGHLVELFLEHLCIEVHLYWYGLEVEFQSSTIVHRVLEGIFAQIAVCIFLRTESSEGVVVAFVDRCTCKTKEEGVRQCLSHLASQVTLLCAVCLVYHHDDIIALREHLSHITKLKDGSDEDLALVFSKEFLQFLFAAC